MIYSCFLLRLVEMDNIDWGQVLNSGIVGGLIGLVSAVIYSALKALFGRKK